jgi:hypothetical protein
MKNICINCAHIGYLGENLVLVHGDESAQIEGGHAVHHDGVCRPVQSIIFLYLFIIMGEDFVLVHGDESAQVEGSHAVHHNGVGQPVHSTIFL